jgi:hypothetical protein
MYNKHIDCNYRAICRIHIEHDVLKVVFIQVLEKYHHDYRRILIDCCIVWIDDTSRLLHTCRHFFESQTVRIIWSTSTFPLSSLFDRIVVH